MTRQSPTTCRPDESRTDTPRRKTALGRRRFCPPDGVQIGVGVDDVVDEKDVGGLLGRRDGKRHAA